MLGKSQAHFIDSSLGIAAQAFQLTRNTYISSDIHAVTALTPSSPDAWLRADHPESGLETARSNPSRVSPVVHAHSAPQLAIRKAWCTPSESKRMLCLSMMTSASTNKACSKVFRILEDSMACLEMKIEGLRGRKAACHQRASTAPVNADWLHLARHLSA